MHQLNYNHLRYFYMVAKTGSIAKAADALHVSPQTISGQITVFEEYLGVKLFERKARQLLVNEMGKVVFSYAEDIFTLGAELQQNLKSRTNAHAYTFTVGVVDVIPKILAVDILEGSLNQKDGLKLVCKEGDFDALLSELALNRIDLILSDRPLGPGVPIRAFNHTLGECGLSFYANNRSASKLKRNFPASLDDYPFLICGDRSNQKLNLRSWFDQVNINPRIVAEFDDSALMKYFGQSGYGVFCTPSIIEEHVTKQYGVAVIGRTKYVRERFYAISPERKVKHPSVKSLLENAQNAFSAKAL